MVGEQAVAGDDRFLGDRGPAGHPQLRRDHALVHLGPDGQPRLLRVLGDHPVERLDVFQGPAHQQRVGRRSRRRRRRSGRGPRTRPSRPVRPAARPVARRSPRRSGGRRPGRLRTAEPEHLLHHARRCPRSGRCSASRRSPCSRRRPPLRNRLQLSPSPRVRARAGGCAGRPVPAARSDRSRRSRWALRRPRCMVGSGRPRPRPRRRRPAAGPALPRRTETRRGSVLPGTSKSFRVLRSRVVRGAAPRHSDRGRCDRPSCGVAQTAGEQQVQHGHPHGDAVGHLLDDHRVQAVRHLWRDLHAAVHRAGVQHDAVVGEQARLVGSRARRTGCTPARWGRTLRPSAPAAPAASSPRRRPSARRPGRR